MRRQLNSVATKQQKELNQAKEFDLRRTCLTDFKTRSKDIRLQYQQINSPVRRPKRLSNDFKEIKDEIDMIKGQIDHYFGNKMTNSCRLIELLPSQSSPLSLLHNSPPQAEVSFASDDSSCSDEEDKFYKIKFKLVSQELESLKRKYHIRKMEHKQLINKLCKKINSLESMAKSKQYDLQEYKKLLGKQVNSIKDQINTCIQHQMATTIMETSREEVIDYDHRLKHMEFSQVLNPEYDMGNEVFRLKEQLDEKELTLFQSQEIMQKLKFENLQLENLLEDKQKSEIILSSLRKQYAEQKESLTSAQHQLSQSKIECEKYRSDLQQMCVLRDIQLRQARDQQQYLRVQLQSSLMRESNAEAEFRNLEFQRRQIHEKQLQDIRNILAEKNVQLMELKGQLKIKQEKVVTISQEIKQNFFVSVLDNQELDELKHITDTCAVLASVQSQYQLKLKQQNRTLEAALLKSNQLVEQLKSKYEQQLYSLQIQYRRKNMEYEDKLNQFIKMIDAKVSDIMLKEQDFQLIEKQQQLQRVTTQLSSAQLKICILEGQINAYHHKNFVKTIDPHEVCSHKISVLQFQNKHLRRLVLSLNKKIHVLFQITHKKEQDIKNEEESLQVQITNSDNKTPCVSDNSTDILPNKSQEVDLLKSAKQTLNLNNLEKVQEQ